MTEPAGPRKSESTGAAIRVRGASRTFGSGASAVHALRGVDLEVAAGELVVLLGPSGSGKTTLLNLIGGIETPSDGSVEVAGRDLSGLDDAGRTAYRRETLGFVFQFYNLVPTLTARENVELILELIGTPDPAERAEEALRAVGLAERLDRFPAELSGGEQQRVAIARALAKRPSLLLCDEPTGALDLETGRVVLALLRELNRAGRTIVIVTHNAAIGAMADRVVRMRSGEIVERTHNAAPIAPDEVAW